MTDLEDTFVELGISQYLDIFIEHGFDSWDTVVDITESDFDILGVKLGHRRKLQRKIANCRGYSSTAAFISPTSRSAIGKLHFDEIEASGSRTELKDGVNLQTGKRKYRRHPKPDDNAPERSPSAYVIFSNKMREDLKGKNFSFTEIAKLVGENWQNLTASEKEPYETQASKAKDRYNAELAEYKKTENYRKYTEYLMEFKEKQARLQQQTTDAAKRPKLESKVSATNVAGNSSMPSQQGVDGQTEKPRVGSVASTTGSWISGESPTSPTQLSTLTTLHLGHGASVGGTGPGSPPNVPQPGMTSRSRDAPFGTTQQSVAWKDRMRDPDAPQLPRLSSLGDSTPSQLESPEDVQAASQNGTFRRIGPIQNQNQRFTPPPLLISESAPGATKPGSSACAKPPPYSGPRIPKDVTLERSLPIPQAYPAKGFENQLPPLRSSMSPQSSINIHYSSPPNIPPLDYPLRNGSRAFAPISAQQTPLPSVATDPGNRPRNSIDESLDPVSALLRADEIVSRCNVEHTGRRI